MTKRLRLLIVIVEMLPALLSEIATVEAELKKDITSTKKAHDIVEGIISGLETVVKAII